ncbi:hypothetical protein K458DRAFT_456446 [Lentithecium fluviatile CBS 122367]|uniref:Uncharacterized protein n=1 Tax=Lentithecium fluviatile CBS 122367 TaxID=1168545 RepID=A0A6G1IVJ5_9PLEO|nr:hypothetical protein K458DRAFT_456446 [Lentithecium fluviatile CBS 122367]
MASAHYHGAHEPLLGFSSWAVSLHLVLCYAEHLAQTRGRNIHVAVIDRQALEGQVLIWHVPQLLNQGCHEYLAYGCIRRPGYKAVAYSAIVKKGLSILFPNIKSAVRDRWGMLMRPTIFAKAAVTLSDVDLKVARDIGSLFGDLDLPVTIALLNLVPRCWAKTSSSRGDIILKAARGIEPICSDLYPPLAIAHSYLVPPVRSRKPALTSNADIRLHTKTGTKNLGQLNVPPDLVSQVWLIEPGMIYTTKFLDIEQWITLLRVIVLRNIQQDTEISVLNAVEGNGEVRGQSERRILINSSYRSLSNNLLHPVIPRLGTRFSLRTPICRGNGLNKRI